LIDENNYEKKVIVCKPDNSKETIKEMIDKAFNIPDTDDNTNKK
jgi:hypothetical protein